MTLEAAISDGSESGKESEKAVEKKGEAAFIDSVAEAEVVITLVDQTVVEAAAAAFVAHSQLSVVALSLWGQDWHA